jgi:hypothetical protein
MSQATAPEEVGLPTGAAVAVAVAVAVAHQGGMIAETVVQGAGPHVGRSAENICYMLIC